jgi:protein O-GlcNAc transferase
VTTIAGLRAVAAVALTTGIALLLACSTPTADMKREASARMQMGVTYLEQRNLPSAMRELTRAAELDPDNSEIAMTLGLAYQARGDIEKSEEFLRKAVRLNPDNAAAHNNLGNILSLQGKGDEAIREYEKAVSNILYPTPEFGYYNMGREYARRKELSKAELMYRRAIAMSPSFVDAYRGLAMVQFEQGQKKEAVRTLERLVVVAPSDARGWIDLGSMYLRVDRKKDALEAFRNAMSNTGDPALRSEASKYINMLEQGKR